MRAKSMQQLTNELKIRFPGIVIGGVGDDAHKLRRSDHNEDDTAGSLAAQSDPDNVPEHRAIDAMLGSAFPREQARPLIAEILAQPVNRQRLIYINFENDQWSRSIGWARRDNSGDPHPEHIHFSGLASEDDNTAPWLTGGNTLDMKATRGMGADAPNDYVLYLQRKMAYLIVGDPRLTQPTSWEGTTKPHPLTIDGDYGGNTSFWVSVLLTGGDGNEVNGAWFAVLDEMILDKKISDIHTGLPASLTLTIPAMTVTATL